jgi:hypothetical protein
MMKFLLFFLTFVVFCNFQVFSQNNNNSLDLEFKDLQDLANNGFYNLLEFGKTKLIDKGFRLARVVEDLDEGNQFTFDTGPYGNKVQLYSSNLLIPSGNGDGVTYDYTIKYSFDNELLFQKILSELKKSGFVKINSKELTDKTKMELYKTKNEQYYFLMIELSDSQMVYVGFNTSIIDIFENNKLNHCNSIK